MSHNNLAALYDSHGRFEEAEPLYTRALEIREKALGPEHPDTAASLNNLAGLYVSQGQYEEAEPLLKRARNHREGLRPETSQHRPHFEKLQPALARNETRRGKHGSGLSGIMQR